MLLHGFGLGGFAWDPILAAFEGVCPLIIYDLPGHAASLNDAAGGGAGRMAKAILADLEARGVSTFHIAGHSLGGAVAVIAAMREPEKVKSVSLIAPGGIGREINHQALGDYARARSPQDIRKALVPLVGTNIDIPEPLVSAMAAARAHPDAIPSLLAIFENMLVSGEDGIFQGTLPMQQLAALPMPVAALWGEDDMIVPSFQAALLPDNVSVRLLSGKGHMLVDEAPEAVTEMLLARIRK